MIPFLAVESEADCTITAQLSNDIAEGWDKGTGDLLIDGLYFYAEDLLVVILGIRKFSRLEIAYTFAVDMIVQKIAAPTARPYGS